MANADEKEYNGRKNQGRLQCVSEIIQRPSGLRENVFGRKRKSGYNPVLDKEVEMEKQVSRKEALELLRKYNKEPFHIRHGLTVEAVMKWYAGQLGYGDDEEFWGIVGLLHDIDFEEYPEQHCVKAPELLREAGVGEDMIHAVVSHGYGLVSDVKPEHEMEKVLYATDELTGLIGAVALMYPSRSVQDMKVKSLKKKFNTPKFAAGCDRDVIRSGAAMLSVELDELFEKTIEAMKASEDGINAELEELGIS